MAETPKFDLSKMSVREIVIVVGTLLSAVGYGFYQFEYQVQTKKVALLEQQSRETQASIGAFQKILINPSRVKKTKAQITKIKNEIVELQTTIKKTKNRLEGQGTEILGELQNEADFYGVFLKSLKTSERTSPDAINVVPILDVRESNNIVLAQSGQTIVIGGLMKTKKEVDDNSVPLLGALPYVGRLFHWNQETVAKTELAILLTPEIMVGKAIDDKFLSTKSQLRNSGYDVVTDRVVTPSFKR